MTRVAWRGLVLAGALTVAFVLASSPSGQADAAIPPPGSTFHRWGLFTDSGRGAYTGVYQRRPDQMPIAGLTSDCNAGVVIPIYYPSWIVIGPNDWVEIGTSFFCTTNWNWYEGWNDFQGFHWRGQQFTPPLGDGQFFQIYRTGEYYHWQIGPSEPVLPMFWNAVGQRAEAGIESYNSQGITNYLVHDTMNVTLSESPWTPFAGFASVSDGSVRMCSVWLSSTSFKEREKSSTDPC